ncbi:MAG: LSU ribosomal protein L33p @ LSU ribosomal protein L33p, zinc-dependent, partial [uncultured Thermomicrobiales bacterium]
CAGSATTRPKRTAVMIQPVLNSRSSARGAGVISFTGKPG